MNLRLTESKTDTFQYQPIQAPQRKPVKVITDCETCDQDFMAIYPHTVAPGVWHVPSSGGTYHLATLVEGGWRCTCIAGSYSRVCYHVKGNEKQIGVLDLERRLALGVLPELHIKYVRSAPVAAPVRRERVKEAW